MDLQYEDIVKSDLELMWIIDDWLKNQIFITTNFSKFVNKNPMYDICSSVWVASIIGLIEIGLPHFWIVSMNLTLCAVLNKLFAVKRPVEYDRRLQPLTDLNAERFGFPSIESYMSVVVFGHLCYVYRSLTLIILGTTMCFLIGTSRIFSRSRFPHQIVGSWILGIFGLVFVYYLHSAIRFEKMSRSASGASVAAVLVCYLCYFSLNTENNDSRILYTKKSEFTRVITDIINQSNVDEPTHSTDHSNDLNDINDEVPSSISLQATDKVSTRIVDTPRSKKLASLHQRRMIKHDSFYFLQRNLEQRLRGIDSFKQSPHPVEFEGRL